MRWACSGSREYCVGLTRCRLNNRWATLLDESSGTRVVQIRGRQADVEHRPKSAALGWNVGPKAVELCRGRAQICDIVDQHRPIDQFGPGSTTSALKPAKPDQNGGRGRTWPDIDQVCPQVCPEVCRVRQNCPESFSMGLNSTKSGPSVTKLGHLGPTSATPDPRCRPHSDKAGLAAAKGGPKSAKSGPKSSRFGPPKNAEQEVSRTARRATKCTRPPSSSVGRFPSIRFVGPRDPLVGPREGFARRRSRGCAVFMRPISYRSRRRGRWSGWAPE